jgi:hypothetical protein
VGVGILGILRASEEALRMTASKTTTTTKATAEAEADPFASLRDDKQKRSGFVGNPARDADGG